MPDTRRIEHNTREFVITALFSSIIFQQVFNCIRFDIFAVLVGTFRYY